MSTTLAILGIAAPVITFLIGRYFKSEKIKLLTNENNGLKTQLGVWRDNSIANQQEVNRLLDYCEGIEKQLGETMAKVMNAQVELLKAPKFQVVANTQKHPAANDNYLYIEGEINGKREAGMLRLKQWDEAKETLSKNPEDKPQ